MPTEYQNDSLEEMQLVVPQPVEEPWSGELNERDLARLNLQALDQILRRTGTLTQIDQDGNIITVIVGHGKEIRSIPVNVNTVSNSTIIEGKSNTYLRVIAFTLQSMGTVLAQFMDDEQALTGQFSFQVREGIAQSIEAPSYLFSTPVGQSLHLQLSANVAVNGFVTYFEESN